MIVLAVSGVIFASAMVLVQRRQPEAEFQQAINDTVTIIRQNVHDVAVGYYPNSGDIQCKELGELQITSATAGQGENQGCIFLGKIMQFGVPGDTGGNQQEIVYTLAGCQHQHCSNGTFALEATSLADAQPKVIAPTTSDTSVPDKTQAVSIENGLSLHAMHFTDTGGTSHSAVAFGALQSFGTYAGNCSGGLCSGSQQTALYGVTNASPSCSDPHNTAEQDKQCLAGQADIPSNLVAASEVTMCFQSATTEQSGLITVAGDGTVGVKIFSSKDCS